MTVSKTTLSRLDMPPLTATDRRAVLLVAARHGAAGDILDGLLELCAPDCGTRIRADLFADLVLAVQHHAEVEAGTRAPSDVLPGVKWSDADIAAGVDKRDALDRCDLDVFELLTLLAPDPEPKRRNADTPFPADW